jgi:hypothetical protein
MEYVEIKISVHTYNKNQELKNYKLFYKYKKNDL